MIKKKGVKKMVKIRTKKVVNIVVMKKIYIIMAKLLQMMKMSVGLNSKI